MVPYMRENRIKSSFYSKVLYSFQPRLYWYHFDHVYWKNKVCESTKILYENILFRLVIQANKQKKPFHDSFLSCLFIWELFPVSFFFFFFGEWQLSMDVKTSSKSFQHKTNYLEQYSDLLRKALVKTLYNSYCLGCTWMWFYASHKWDGRGLSPRF